MSQLYEIAPASSVDLESSRIAKLPILLLNVHSHCNCRCVMCDIWKRSDSREFPVGSLEKHRESFRNLGVRHVVMTGGEPLLHRELASLCGFFREFGIRTTLLTTGLLLEKKADIVVNGFDDIILSLDGPAEVHDQVRRIPRAFEVIQRGVKAVRLRHPLFPISCRTTVQRINHNRLCDTVSAARSLGLDSISFLAADISSTAFNREQKWPSERADEIALDKQEVDELDHEIERLIQLRRVDPDEGFITESDEKLRRIVTRFRERINGTVPKAPMCNAPWVSAVMEVDGSVRPCFFHPPVADINWSSLEDAINSYPALLFRNRLDVANDPVCRRCVCSLNYRAEPRHSV